MVMDAVLTKVWKRSKRLAKIALKASKKLVDKLERKRTRAGNDLIDARERKHDTWMEIESRKLSGKDVKRARNALAFYKINVDSFEQEILDIDRQIVIARGEMHDAANRIAIAERKMIACS